MYPFGKELKHCTPIPTRLLSNPLCASCLNNIYVAEILLKGDSSIFPSICPFGIQAFFHLASICLSICQFIHPLIIHPSTHPFFHLLSIQHLSIQQIIHLPHSHNILIWIHLIMLKGPAWLSGRL